jgi:hypothetical protein
LQAAPGRDQQEAEAKFKSHIAEYRDRAAKHANQVQREVRAFVSALWEVIGSPLSLSPTQMERDRLSKAHTATAVKFYAGLSPDNSVDGRDAPNGRRRGFSREECGDLSDEDELSDITQSRPFSTPLKRNGNLEEDERGDAHLYIVESSKYPELAAKKGVNATEIERELATALMMSDIDHLRTTATQEAEEDQFEVYEDAQFFKRPKIVQVIMRVPCHCITECND